MEKVTLTNMCMIYDKNKILVQNRTKKDWPGITFPGGHVDEGEHVDDSVIREVYEETGLTISNIKLCGVCNWYSKATNERIIVFCYKTNNYEGVINNSSEGEVFWIERKDLKNYQLSNDFKEILEVFESDDLNEFFMNW